MKIQALAKDKAAKLLSKAVTDIITVTMNDEGAMVHCTNGNRLHIPYPVWALGVSAEDYERTIINRI